MGRGLARARKTSPKHGIKQLDRLLINEGIVLEDDRRAWTRWVVSTRQTVVVALDWTEPPTTTSPRLRCTGSRTTVGRRPDTWSEH